MRIEGHIYCDAPDCEINSHIGPDRFAGPKLVSLPLGWFRVIEHTAHTLEWAFCSGDCVMKWAAAWSEPPEVIEGPPDA